MVKDVQHYKTQAYNACFHHPTHQGNSQSLRESDAEEQTLPLHQGCPVIQSSTAWESSLSMGPHGSFH